MNLEVKLEISAEEAEKRKLMLEMEQDFVTTITNPAEFFRRESAEVWTCGDEGCIEGIHDAGSLILLEDEAEVDRILQERKENGLHTLTSHDGCGAGKLRASKEGITDPDEVLAFVQNLTRERAERNGLQYRHITSAEMDRGPKHDATVIYYDGTGRFNRVRTQRQIGQNSPWPRGYVVSRIAGEYTAGQLPVFVGIIESANNYGPNFFTEENPIIVYVLGNSGISADQLIREAQAQFGDKRNVRVIGASVSDEVLEADLAKAA